jgi:hypothetical protein
MGNALVILDGQTLGQAVTAGVSAPSLIQTQRVPNYERKELR